MADAQNIAIHESLRRRLTPFCIYYNAKLSGKDLSGLNLSGSSMPFSDFSNAILRGVNFTAANLSEADFRGADLTGAILDSAILGGADLTGAILDDIDLGYSGYFIEDERTKLPPSFSMPPRHVQEGRGYGEMTAPIIKLSKPGAPMRARDFKRAYPREFEKLASINGGRDFSPEFIEKLKSEYASEIPWKVTRGRYSDSEQRAHPDVNRCMLFSLPAKDLVNTKGQLKALMAAREYFRTRSHPLDPDENLFTIGYIRFAEDPINKVWLIEEIQSDAGGLAYRDAEHCSFHEEAHDDFGVLPSTTRKILPALKEYANSFYKDALAIFMLEAAKEGYTVEIMSYLDKKAMINEDKAGPPTYPYSGLPREMGITGKRQSVVLPQLKGRVSYYTPNPGVPSWRSDNPPGEKSPDDKIREIKRRLKENRASYQNRDRHSEYALQEMLLPLIEQHPYEGAAVITSTYSQTLGGRRIVIAALDNRNSFADFDISLLEAEDADKIRERVRFYSKRPYAAAILVALPDGNFSLAAVEYFPKESQARSVVDEVGKRSRARRLDFSDEGFVGSFIDIAQAIRSGADQNLAEGPSTVLRRSTAPKPTVAASEVERLATKKAEDARERVKRSTNLIPEIPELGRSTRRIIGKDYIVDVLYSPTLMHTPNERRGGSAPLASDRCVVNMYLDDKVVRSFWFRLDKGRESNQVNAAMRLLNSVISSASGPPEKPGFLNALNRLLPKYLEGYGSV